MNTVTPPQPAPSSDRTSIWAWAVYDWANSAFATTVMAGFFPVFFKEFWNTGVDSAVSTARLGAANSLAGILVAILAPVLGAIADRGTRKKRFLLFFATLGIASTGALYFIERGDWLTAALIYALATIGFSGGNIFYDALLPGVAPKNRSDAVSALGYSLGYLGGGILFALNVWMVMRPGTFGLPSEAAAVKVSFVTVAVWWALFSVPLFLRVREPVLRQRAAGWKMVSAGVHQLRDTFREIRHLKTIFLFLLAYWLYIDGVDTIIRMAIDYGISLGFKPNDLILALLITQFVGFPAAIAFGWMGQRIGTRRAIFFGLGVYLSVSIWGAFIDSHQEFYALAVIIGLVQGGVQALSRSFFSRIIPADKSAEYFGFYNMIGKFAVVLGPILIGGTTLLAHSLGLGSHLAARIGIASLALLFLAGGILLAFVNEHRGQSEAVHLSELSKPPNEQPQKNPPRP